MTSPFLSEDLCWVGMGPIETQPQYVCCLLSVVPLGKFP